MIKYSLLVVTSILLASMIASVDAQLDTHECNSVSFPCMDPQGVPRCIPNSWICDGFSDCADNMDEANCYYTETNCTANPLEIFQCGATKCFSPGSSIICNGIIDCRGYNGTYVNAPYGIDESPEFCSSATTSTTTIFPSSRGWQPGTFTTWAQVPFTTPSRLRLSSAPFTQLTTTDSFWRGYCNRQVSVNYCPRRCELHGLCAPLRVNPPRWEIAKMSDEMNPPVVGPRTKPTGTPVTPTTTTTTEAGPTTTARRQRLLNELQDELLERLLQDESRYKDVNSAPLPNNLPSRHGGGNSLDAVNNKKRRDSAVDPGVMADTNMIYDWSDDEASGAMSLASSLVFILVTLFATTNNLLF